MKVHVTTTLEREMYDLAKNNKIKFAEALAYGINGKLNRTRDDLERAELRTRCEKYEKALDKYISSVIPEMQDEIILLKSELQKVNQNGNA